MKKFLEVKNVLLNDGDNGVSLFNELQYITNNISKEYQTNHTNEEMIFLALFKYYKTHGQQLMYKNIIV